MILDDELRSLLNVERYDSREYYRRRNRKAILVAFPALAREVLTWRALGGENLRKAVEEACCD